jgi:hypothetical protein
VVIAPLLHNSVRTASVSGVGLILIRVKPSLPRPSSDFRLGREGATTMELRPTMGTGERQHRLSILDRCHPSKIRSSQVDTENRGTASVSSRCFHCMEFSTITEHCGCLLALCLWYILLLRVCFCNYAGTRLARGD